MNKFIKHTLKGLNIKETDPKISIGFKVRNNKEEDTILIFGINPAGYEKEAEYSRTHALYLGYTGGSNIPDQVNNRYFGGIYRFVNAITNNSCKFEWCNNKFEKIEQQLPNLTPKQIKDIRKFYDNHKDNQYTIYLGDLFSYHTTAAKRLYKYIKKDIDKRDYALKMLQYHIEELQKHNKKPKLIYINNAEVSSWLQNGENKTFEYIEGIPVFYGGMLTGQHAMDITSVYRLINEIKNKIKL